MHGIRSSILANDGKKRSPRLEKGNKSSRQRTGEASLAAVPVKREESRVTDQREEVRHPLRVEEASLYFRRRRHDATLLNLSGGGAMVEADIEPVIGEQVEIQFADCNRTHCEVRWVRGSRIGLEFVDETQIIAPRGVQDYILELVARGEASGGRTGAGVQRRKAAVRHGLIWTGEIHSRYGSVPARLRNISTEGAMIEAAGEFRVGLDVVLELGAAGAISAVVRWTRGDELGVSFDEPFDLSNLAYGNIDATELPEWMQPEYLKNGIDAESEWGSGDRPLTLEELEATLRGRIKG
ncbi:MAG: PilZ domain-containing protein [Sphingomonadaceae bacterium]